MEIVRAKMAAVKPVCMTLIRVKLKTPVLRISIIWKNAANKEAKVITLTVPFLEARRLKRKFPRIDVAV